MAHLRGHLVLSGLACAAALAPALASPEGANAASGAVISNGVVQLGVNAAGDLNYSCGEEPGCPEPSVTGVAAVGLRYVPLNLESIAPGCPCEGWGAADAVSGLTGYANESTGEANITVDSFESPSPQEAVSAVSIANEGLSGHEMRVVQRYHPTPLTPNVYVDSVTISNTGTAELEDLRYRRNMDWDIEPTPFAEWVSNEGESPQLLFDSDDGFASSNPLSGPSYRASQSVCGAAYLGPCQFKDLGAAGTYPKETSPADHGALFDFGFGKLAPGESRSFNVYYGAAASEAAALGALSAVGAQVYSLGESSCRGGTIASCGEEPGPAVPAGVAEGKPATFMFGFVTTVGDLSIAKTGSPDPVTVGQNLTYTITVSNDGPDAAAGVQVTDRLPGGVEFVSASADQGSCSGTSTVTCDLGSIALNGSAQVTIVVRPTSPTPDLVNTAGVSSTSSDANPANDSATSHTRVLPAASEPAGVPPPKYGARVSIAPVKGVVLVKLPGSKRFVRLTEAGSFPVGTIIDVTGGRVRLTSARNRASTTTETADFYGGVFQVQQPGSGKPITVLKLVGAAQRRHSRRARLLRSPLRNPSAQPSRRRRGNGLWGSGHGNFKTTGSYGAASVRGTIWFTQDRTDGTFFKVKRGVVQVEDFTRHRRLKLHPGQQYLAPAG